MAKSPDVKPGGGKKLSDFLNIAKEMGKTGSQSAPKYVVLPDIHAPTAFFKEDYHGVPPRKHTVKGMVALMRLFSFPGFVGATCTHCGATANLLNGDPFSCSCGADNPPSSQVVHKHPTYGPNLSSIRLAQKLKEGKIGPACRKRHKYQAQKNEGKLVESALDEVKRLVQQYPGDFIHMHEPGHGYFEKSYSMPLSGGGLSGASGTGKSYADNKETVQAAWKQALKSAESSPKAAEIEQLFKKFLSEDS